MNPEKEYPRPFHTVDCIILIDGPTCDKILLIDRKNIPYGWALPGGFLNEGESLENAVRREVKEETNLDLARLKQFHTYSAPDRDPRGWIISTVFHAIGIGSYEARDDAKGAQLFDLYKLPDVIPFDHRTIIENFISRKY